MDKTAAIRSQARRAALTKAAAAQFTPEEQAFAAGFCKAAEAMGVDPEALYKEALPAWIANAGRAVANSRVGQAVGRGAKSYWGALTGSRLKQLRESVASLGRDKDAVSRGLANARSTYSKFQHSSAASNAAIGSNLRGKIDQLKSDLLGLITKRREAIDATRRARTGMIAARTGTALAGAGGLYGLGRAAFGGGDKSAT